MREAEYDDETPKYFLKALQSRAFDFAYTTRNQKRTDSVSYAAATLNK